MSDFEAFADDIAIGMEYLEHHQILGAKWGVMNGPPYPLGSGDHSSSEKKAAEAAGIKVGSDSGKGSIDNVKKKKTDAQNKVKKAKKEMTPEERREKALEAARSGDKKKIAKYINELSTDELRDAQARAQMKDSLKKQDPSEQKASKEDIEKREAMLSGDKEKVKQYADKMSYAELAEAMNKVNLMTQLNHVDPPPSAMDKLTAAMNKVDQFRSAAEKGINAYNLAAKVYNSTHKDGGKWPIIGGNDGNKEKSQEQKVAESLAKQAFNDVQRTAQQNRQQQEQKSHKEQAEEALRNAKIDYKNQKKMEKWVAKQEAKEKAKAEGKKEQSNEEKTSQEQKPANAETTSTQNEKQYTPERAPQLKKTFFNTKKFDDAKSEKEPTEEQKRLVEEARKSDEQYLNQLSQMSRQEVKTTYDRIKDTPISSYDKQYQKEINESFNDIMSDYNESVRRQQVTAQERQDRAETVNNAKKLMRDALREDNNDAAAYWLEVIRNNE